jgi:hypothetical protein
MTAASDIQVKDLKIILILCLDTHVLMLFKG